MNTRGDFWSEATGFKIAPKHFSDIVATAADIALVLDQSGMIQDVIANPLNMTLGKFDHWKGRDIRLFLTVDSKPKIEKQLARLLEGEAGSVDGIEINHRDNADWEFPVRYTMHKANDENLILMLGRDLRPVAELQQRLVNAQLALEKDYENHRDFETRFRVLMDATRDAFVLVDVHSGRISEANTLASEMLGAETDALNGLLVAQEFISKSSKDLVAMLVEGSSDTDGKPIIVGTKRLGNEVVLYPTLFRAGGTKTLLCRLEKAGSSEAVATELVGTLLAMFRNGADGIAITDSQGVIRSANESFLNLCDVGQLSEVRGHSLADFFVRGGVDLKVMMENASRSGKMRNYSTRISTAFGSKLPVEISVTKLNAPTDSGFAFSIRDTSRLEVIREPSAAIVSADGQPSNEAVENVVGLVGSAPLKEILAATTDVIEKMCIEAAISLTNNNRVAAAEMLGLSRQSLYVKLRKYDLLARSEDS